MTGPQIWWRNEPSAPVEGGIQNAAFSTNNYRSPRVVYNGSDEAHISATGREYFGINQFDDLEYVPGHFWAHDGEGPRTDIDGNTGTSLVLLNLAIASLDNWLLLLLYTILTTTCRDLQVMSSVLAFMIRYGMASLVYDGDRR